MPELIQPPNKNKQTEWWLQCVIVDKVCLQAVFPSPELRNAAIEDHKKAYPQHLIYPWAWPEYFDIHKEEQAWT